MSPSLFEGMEKYDIIQSLEDSANNAFAVLTQLETSNQEQSLSESLRYLHEVQKGARVKRTESERLLQFFRDSIQKNMMSVFGSDHLFSVVIYFMPGTSEPIPIYFDGKNKWTDIVPERGKSYRQWMEERIVKISDDLKYGFMPRMEDTKGNHFFYCAYIQAKAMAKALCENRIVPDQLTSPSGGFSDFTVWADPRRDEKFVLQLEKANPDNSDHLIEWEGYESLDRPPMLSSPVFVDDNSLVLMVSYFERDHFRNLLSDEINFRSLLGLHGLFARQVFGGVFASILRSDMSTLRRNLGRYHISRTLLKETAHYLFPKEDETIFTYQWKVQNISKKLNCADIRNHLYGDVIKEPDKATTRVLEVQKSIYREMLGSKIESLKFNFPRDMPLAAVLESLEEAQRALHTKKRDHIIHQFQVFLLGTLIINKFKDKFLNAIAISSKSTIGVELKKENPLTFDLLKMAWFLCATLHDVGYPVQDIDGFVTTIRGSVAQLLNLPAFRLDVPPRLRIDQVLYDDPRAYVLLRKMTKYLTEWSKVGNFETWWYFIRQLTFNEKHHALASALALGLACLPRFSRTSYSAMDSAGFDLFMVRHILLPIALHHAYDWCENVKKIENEYKDQTKDENATKQEQFQARKALSQFKSVIQPIRKFFAERPKRKNHLLVFDEFPLGVLLAICDFIQESGRLSVDRKPEWPSDAIDYVEYGNSPEDLFKIALEIQYDGSDIKGCEDDLNRRFYKVDRLRSLFEVSCFDDLLCVIIYGRHSKGWSHSLTNQIMSGPGKDPSKCKLRCKHLWCSHPYPKMEQIKDYW